VNPVPQAAHFVKVIVISRVRGVEETVPSRALVVVLKFPEELLHVREHPRREQLAGRHRGSGGR
jgi:hypothetical protein